MNTLEQLTAFCNTYFQHVVWEEFRQIPPVVTDARSTVVTGSLRLPYIRFSLIPSDELVEKSHGVISTTELQVFKDEKLGHNLKRLLAMNSRGYHLYYFCNQVRSDLLSGQKYATNDDIERRLFIPLDFDFALPCSTEDLEDALGMKFAAAIKSSSDEHGKSKYHCLIPIYFEGELAAEWRVAIEQLQRILCSDPIADEKRIMRAPGSINWKYAHKPLCELVYAAEEYEVYDLKDIQKCTGTFSVDSSFTALLGELMAAKASQSLNKNSKKSQTLKKQNEENVPVHSSAPEDLLGWRAALEHCETEGSEPLYDSRCGFRHNALRRWGAQMAYERLEFSKIHRNLLTLAQKAFDKDYSATRDFGALVKSMKKFSVGIEKAQEYFSGEYGDTTESMEDNQGATSGNVVPLPKESKQIEALSLLEYAHSLASILPNETQEEYIRFLSGACILAHRAQSKTSGIYEPICKWLLERLIGLKMCREGALVVPEFTKRHDGRILLGPRYLDESECKSFLTEYISAICIAVSTHKKELHALKSIKDQGSKFIVGISAKGSVMSSLIQGMTGKILLSNNKTLQPSDIIIFQNGIYKLSGGNDRTEIAAGFKEEKETLWFDQARWLYSNPIQCWFNDELFLNGHAKGSKLELMPLLNAFLEDTFSGEENKSTREELFFRIVGYCLIRGNPYQKFFGFVGATGAGKGVACEIIEALCGVLNTHRLTYASLSEPWGLAPLENKTFCIIDEAESADRRIHENAMSKLKMYTGANQVSSRKMHSHERVIDTSAKLIITCNKELSFSDTGGALGRRFICLYFSNTKKQTEQISTLSLKIAQREGDLLASWAAMQLGNSWNEGLNLFEMESSAALQEGREEVENTTSPVLNILRKFVRPVKDHRVNSALLGEFVNLAIKLDKISKPTSRLERVIKDSMKRLGYGYHRTNINRGFKDCKINSIELVDLFEMTAEELGKKFSQSSYRVEIYEILGLTNDDHEHSF